MCAERCTVDVRSTIKRRKFWGSFGRRASRLSRPSMAFPAPPIPLGKCNFAPRFYLDTRLLRIYVRVRRITPWNKNVCSLLRSLDRLSSDRTFTRSFRQKWNTYFQLFFRLDFWLVDFVETSAISLRMDTLKKCLWDIRMITRVPIWRCFA